MPWQDGHANMVNACTITARNYLPYARVLAQSFVSHHQGGDFSVLLIDDEERAFDDRSEPFSCHRLSEIGLSPKEISQLAAIYDVTEFATAVKPQFLRKLLSEGRDHVLYLDPDIKVYDSLESAALLARQHGIVLTPHMTSPLPRDGLRINDTHILSSGVYNLGFIGLGGGTESFIEWWWSRTRRDALIDPNHMMFTDQRWIDYVPSFFRHHILRHPGYNVAYWNLHERDLTWTGDRYLASGQPLTFFHFSGFSTDAPHLLSKHQGDRPRILLSDRPALRRICDEYHADLLRAGLRAAAPPYGWSSLPSGLPFDRRMRRLYRAGLEAFESGKAAEPPTPFESEADFIAWLNEPIAVGPRPRVSRYLYAVYQDRPDLQAAFPNLAGVDCSRYFLWLPGDGVTQENIPPVLLPPLDAPATVTSEGFANASDLREGLNIAGYFRAELGIGEAARLIRSAAEFAGIPHSTVDYDITDSRRSHPYVASGDGQAPYDVNVVCVNADRVSHFAHAIGPEFFRARHTVGYWFWELEQFPSEMHAGFDVVDEVWAATRFVTEAIGRIGRRPVHHIPLAVTIPVCARNVTRDSLQLPTGFLFLFIFDFFSTIERKNPLGLIQAFKRAFRPGEGPTLLLKTINGGGRLTDLERLRAATRDRLDILLVDEYYTAEMKNALLRLSDCYVSLHRSEGFGLTIAEAMALERPVIATAYSGNLDFTTPDNSYLVDYDMSAVSAGGGPYAPGSPWANPKIEHAAELMRRVYEARGEAAAKAARAQRDILTTHSLEASAATVTRRLEAIRHSRRPAAIESPKIREAPVAARLADVALKRLTTLTATSPAASTAPAQRSLRQMAQKVLFRAFRPYWAQRQIQAFLLEGLRDAKATAEKAAAVEPHQQRAIAAMWTALHAVESKQSQAQAEIDALHLVAQDERSAARTDRLTAQSLVDRLEAQLASIRTTVDAFQRGVDANLLQQRLDVEAIRRAAEQDRCVSRKGLLEVQGLMEVLEARVAAMQSAAVTVQRETATELSLLREQHRLLADTGTILANRLYAPPYMVDPDRFHVVSGSGRRSLGYDSCSGPPGEGYRSFEDIFRGTESLIRARLRVYVPLLQACERVADIGSGRGEMLDLLRDAGVPAIGIDADAGMVAHCRSKGHSVEHTDALTYLSGEPDASLGAIFAAQVVEHFTYDDLMAFLRLSQAKVKPGGRLIFETVNPHAIEAFKTFWTDLTHVRPIFPEVALTWCWLSGFERADVLFPNGSGDLEEDRRTQGEYAVIAVR